MSTLVLIALLVAAVVCAWRLFRAAPLAALAAVAVAGWLGHDGVLGTPAPVRAAVSSAEAWRDERIAALRCRAAVRAALASGDDDQVVRRLEAACGDRARLARATV
jgi:hypothetical protein